MTIVLQPKKQKFTVPHQAIFPVWVSVRETWRAYGGPEEGGWHYDASVQHKELKLCRNAEEYHRHADQLCEDFELRGHDRVPSRWDGRNCCEIRLLVTTERPQNQDNPRPRYE